MPAGTSSPTLQAMPSFKRLGTSYFKKLESVELLANLCPPGSRLAAAIYSVLPAGVSLPAGVRRDSGRGSPEEQLCIPRRRHSGATQAPSRRPHAHRPGRPGSRLCLAPGCPLQPYRTRPWGVCGQEPRPTHAADRPSCGNPNEERAWCALGCRQRPKMPAPEEEQVPASPDRTLWGRAGAWPARGGGRGWQGGRWRGRGRGGVANSVVCGSKCGAYRGGGDGGRGGEARPWRGALVGRRGAVRVKREPPLQSRLSPAGREAPVPPRQSGVR